MLTLKRRVRWLAPLAIVSASVVATSPAFASCAEPIPISDALEQAHTVFVGTVTAVDYDGRVATFDVADVWKGDVEAVAVVAGGPTVAELEEARSQGGDIATSVDRAYELGATYLVVSYGSDADGFRDNQCSNTQIVTSDLDQHRPANAGPPVAVPPATPPTTPPAASSGLGPYMWAIVSGGGLLVLAGILADMRRRSRHKVVPV